MSAPYSPTPSGEPEALRFDPTAPEAVRAALVMTHALNELPQGDVPQEAVDQTLPVVDQAREAAMTVIKDSPLPNGRRIRRLSQEDLENSESTGFVSGVAEGSDDRWMPATTDEIEAAKEEIVFNPTEAMVAKAALERRATKHLLSLNPEVRADRREARDVLRGYFGKHYPVHEAASHVVDAAFRLGGLAVLPVVVLSKVSHRR